jgi:radical SAM protein with 4Fe4S-binding SPASM domain
MVRHAAARGISTRIITNGMLLPRERIARLIDAGLGELMISVDGLNEAHTALRHSGSEGWRTTIRCVEDAVALGIRTRVSTTAFRSNQGDIIPLLHLVNDLGAQCYSVFLGSPLGRGHGMIREVIDPYAWRALQDAVTKQLPSLRQDLEVVLEQGFQWADGPRIDRSALKGRGTGCNTLLEDYDYLIVRSDGNLYQCVYFMTEGKPIGTVLDPALDRVLKHALDRAVYRPFTQANDKCCSCSHQVDCGTGCRGYAYLYKGDWLKTDPRCSKSDPGSESAPPYFPLCPILKYNARTGAFGGSSEQALGG